MLQHQEGDEVTSAIKVPDQLLPGNNVATDRQTVLLWTLHRLEMHVAYAFMNIQQSVQLVLSMQPDMPCTPFANVIPCPFQPNGVCRACTIHTRSQRT